MEIAEICSKDTRIERRSSSIKSTRSFGSGFSFHLESAYRAVFDRGKTALDRVGFRVVTRGPILPFSDRSESSRPPKQWDHNFFLIALIPRRAKRSLGASAMALLIALHPSPRTEEFDLSREALALSLKILIFSFDPVKLSEYPILDATDMFPFDPCISQVLRSKILQEGGNDGILAWEASSPKDQGREEVGVVPMIPLGAIKRSPARAYRRSDSKVLLRNSLQSGVMLAIKMRSNYLIQAKQSGTGFV